MEQSELLHFVVSALERLGLRYFVTGSTVTIFFGEPRFTNDIDIVVDLPEGAVPSSAASFRRTISMSAKWRPLTLFADAHSSTSSSRAPA